MPLLIMQDDDGGELLRVTIRKVEPSAATVAILTALDALQVPKKTRADKGKRREPKLNLPLAAKVTPADPVLS